MENKDTGRGAFPEDVAFGALYIQRKLGPTDRELIDKIAENPYMQYFIGYKEYRNESPFDPSLLVTFRKRLPESVMSEILERMVIGSCGVKDTWEIVAGRLVVPRAKPTVATRTVTTSIAAAEQAARRRVPVAETTAVTRKNPSEQRDADNGCHMYFS